MHRFVQILKAWKKIPKVTTIENKLTGNDKIIPRRKEFHQSKLVGT